MKFRNYDNYDVFEDGRIYSYKKKKFLKPKTNQDGYKQVALTDNEGNKKYIAEVVAEDFKFVGNRREVRENNEVIGEE